MGQEDSGGGGGGGGGVHEPSGLHKATGLERGLKHVNVAFVQD